MTPTEQAPRTGETFRRDINGLRAWAVGLVVLYHFGVGGFEGGFIGVDIFFVISGFLMTGIIVRSLEQDRFSLFAFYLARARRIVPALLVMCVLLFIGGWFVLLPPDYEVLGRHIAASLLFLSNFQFMTEAGYFDTESHEKWLLHTWSLSVEWQFYLILPVLLMAAWRLPGGAANKTRLLVVVFILSLGASVHVTQDSPSTAFFMLHTRAWEMLAGGLVFCLQASGRFNAARWRQWLSHCGLLLALLGVALFDHNTPWPSWRALLPVFGACLVIFAATSSVWTDGRVAQWLGDRSYSIYLWHWPACVAVGYLELRGDLLATVAGLVFSLLAGHLSYVSIETAARRRLTAPSPRISAALLTAALCLPAAAAYAVASLGGAQGRFAPAAEAAAAEAKNVGPQFGLCRLGKTVNPACTAGGPSLRVVMLGDSHAGSVFSALVAANADTSIGIRSMAAAGCPYLPGLRTFDADSGRPTLSPQCPGVITRTRQAVLTMPPEVAIVVVNRYSRVALGRNEDPPASRQPMVYFTEPPDTGDPTFIREFSEHITRSGCELSKGRTVYMIRPIPEMGVHIPKVLSRRMTMGSHDDISISLEEYRSRSAWIWAAQDAARDQCGVRILDPLPYLCREGRCYGSQNGRPIYADSDHLSEWGNKLLVPMFTEVFQGLR